MAFPMKAGPRSYPVEGCIVQAETQTDTKMQFCHWHVLDTMVIKMEGKQPHQRCHMCNILVPWRSLNGQHQRTVQCKNGADQRRWRLAAEEERAVTSWLFSTYGLPLRW